MMTKNHHKLHHFLSLLQDAFPQQVFPTCYSSTLLKVPQNKPNLKNPPDKKSNQQNPTPQTACTTLIEKTDVSHINYHSWAVQ